MKRNDLMLVLAIIGLLAAFYWNRRNTRALASINARLAPGLVPDLGNVDPRILPGTMPVERNPIEPVDPVNRPGVAVNVYSGDSSIYSSDVQPVGVDEGSGGYPIGYGGSEVPPPIYPDWYDVGVG